MFLKKLQRKKNGKGHTYWALAESYRTARGSRHRVMTYLGELKSRERKGWAELAAKFGGGRAALVQGRLFDAGGESDVVPECVMVDVRGGGCRRRRTSVRCGWGWCCGGRWDWTGFSVG